VYPVKAKRPKAWAEFAKLKPDRTLLDRMPQKAAIARYLRILSRWRLSPVQWEKLGDLAVLRLTRRFPMPGEVREIAAELREEVELRANTDYLARIREEWQRQAAPLQKLDLWSLAGAGGATRLSVPRRKGAGGHRSRLGASSNRRMPQFAAVPLLSNRGTDGRRRPRRSFCYL
jgi:hypothetical protein